MFLLMQVALPTQEQMPKSELETIIYICIVLLLTLSGAGYLLLNSQLKMANSLRDEFAEARKDHAVQTEKRDDKFLGALAEARDLHKEAIGTIVQDNKQSTTLICQTFDRAIDKLSTEMANRIEAAKCRHDGARG